MQLAFSKNLANSIDELFQTSEDLVDCLPANTDSNKAILQSTYDLAHKLAGSSGTFQFTEVYNASKNLEHFCKSLLDTEHSFPEDWLTQIQQLKAEIKQASRSKNQALSQLKTSFPTPNKDIFASSKANKILLVDDDELLASLIKEQAKHFGYQINCLTNPEELSCFLDKECPEIILMDIVFPNHSLNGIDLINQLKTENKIHCPVIFLSNREDFNARLEAIRAGGNGYIVKPVNILELIEILDRHSHKKDNNNYRALIIDADTNISSYYEKILSSHNFDCRLVNHPKLASKTLLTFHPDIILIDINTPDCNGFEMAEVIRQDNQFTHIPILFLTSENEHEIEALKAGGDCFLSKNSDNKSFITNVISHSQRSRELHTVIDRLRNDAIRFQSVCNTSSDAIISLNKSGLIILWNQGAENIFGYQSLEVIGQSIEIIIPPQYQEKHRKGFQRLISNSSQLSKHSIETQAITKDQRLISIELTYTEWLSGTEHFFTSIIRDTTQRKAIENELKNQQENLKAIVANSAEGIVTIDTLGLIEMVNPKALEIFSYTAGELEGQNISVLMPKAMRRQHAQYLSHSEIHAQKIINKSRELQGLRKDGSVFPLELNVSPMSIDGVKKYVGILHDITDRKIALESITAAKLEAENANKAKSQFLSSMSHELRTPLNAVLGFAQLLQEDKHNPLDEDQKDSLSHIYSAEQHLLTLIDEVLDLSKIESGKININFESINLVQHIKQSLEFIHPFAHNSQINLDHKLPEEETIWVLADTFRLNQVISNLLTNAIKYNKPHGNVSVWLSQNNGKVRVFVKDTGCGIPDDMMKDLFIPFNRLRAAQSEIEGTGIGLTITKMLVEMMGGTIGVENTYGKGCTFWVQLKKSDSPEMTKTLSAPALHSKPGLQQTPLVKILYIEDNPANRLLIKKIITAHTDFEYNEAFTGSEGIQAALKIEPHIILLDINLPDMNGFEVFKQLQKNNLSENTKVIVISANAMSTDISKGQEFGFFDYITKPIDQHQLLATLHKALETS